MRALAGSPPIKSRCMTVSAETGPGAASRVKIVIVIGGDMDANVADVPQESGAPLLS